MTLGGGAAVATALALTLTHSPALEGLAPWWVYVANALLLLAYQTLDGCDGKQARRTASGSALGELMDHGVDAVVVGAIVAVVCDAFAFGLLSPWPWILLGAAQASFHASNLTLLLSGRMLVNTLDATELQLAIMAVELVTAAAGPRFWRTMLPLPLPLAQDWLHLDWRRGVPLRELVAVLSAIGMATNLVRWARSLATTVRETPPGSAQNGAARQLMRQGAVVAGFATVLGRCYLRCVAASDARTKLALLLLCSCFGFGDAMARMLVTRVAAIEMPLAPPGLLCLLSFTAAAERSTAACYAVLALAVGLHLTYFVTTTRVIAAALGIRVLRIKSKAHDSAKAN